MTVAYIGCDWISLLGSRLSGLDLDCLTLGRSSGGAFAASKRYKPFSAFLSEHICFYLLLFRYVHVKIRSVRSQSGHTRCVKQIFVPCICILFSYSMQISHHLWSGYLLLVTVQAAESNLCMTCHTCTSSALTAGHRIGRSQWVKRDESCVLPVTWKSTNNSNSSSKNSRGWTCTAPWGPTPSVPKLPR